MANLIQDIGIPAIILALLYIGAKIQVLDDLKTDLENNIKPDLKDVRERFAALEGKTAGLFEQHSPISLTVKGNEYLKNSSLKEFIDINTDMLIAGCSQKGKMETPYDVQQSVFDFFDSYIMPDEVENKVKTYAFNQGINMDIMRRVGAIYFRDICLDKLGFSREDLDRVHTSQQ